MATEPEGVTLAALLKMQDELQRESYAAGSPTGLDGEERIEFIRWNVLALEDELHEMLQETGWKPWASARHVNEEAALKELIDAFHFFLNLMLVVAPSSVALAEGPEGIAQLFVDGYATKRLKNAVRQAEGYDGLNKCPHCKRALDDIEMTTTSVGTLCVCGTLIT